MIAFPSQTPSAVLPGGASVLYLPVTSVAHVSIGWWVTCGGVHQAVEENGYAHLLEHLLFKGSNTSNAYDLGVRMDALGGQINAYTDREHTVYHGSALTGDALDLLALLAEIVLEPVIPSAELQKEKQVVAREAASVQEDPEERIHDHMSRLLWGEHPLSWPLLGRSGVIRRATFAKVHEFYQRHYRPERMLIAIAGNFDLPALAAYLQERFAGVAPESTSFSSVSPEMLPVKRRVVRGDVQQGHVCLGSTAWPAESLDSYGALVANQILAGGHASRLFFSLREKHGLAYQVYGTVEGYREVGEWRIYTACDARKWRRCVALIEEQLAHLMDAGPEADELEQAKRQVLVQYYLGISDPEQVMLRTARQWLYGGRSLSNAEVEEKIHSFTVEMIRDLFRQAWEQHSRIVLLPRELPL